MLRTSLAVVSVAATALIAACSRPAEPPKPPPSAEQAVNTTASAMTGVAHPTQNEGAIAWRKGDVDAAFADARVQRLPVFLYWGAIWCPPCNQVKATIFNRQDFVDRARFASAPAVWQFVWARYHKG